MKRSPIYCKFDSTKGLIRHLLGLSKAKETILPSVWQELYRVSPPGSPIPGKWRNWCYQIEPMDSIMDGSCSSLTLMWCSQLIGKSSIIEGILSWMIDQAPSTCVFVHPTSDNANAWSKNRFGPLIESCEKISKLIDSTQTRKGTRSGYGQNTVTHKKFPGGWIIMPGSNSGANLRAHTAKITIFDEVDAFEKSVGEEGDPIILVEQRSARYPDAFSIKTSTPTIKHFSRIEAEMQKTDFRKWTIKCEHCNSDWVIMWGDIKWPKSKDEKGKTIHQVEDSYLECPVCHHHYDDTERMRMVEGGRWIASNPSETANRGYWANAFIVLGPVKRGFRSWLHYFAKRFLDSSKLGIEGQTTFQNLVCGETFESEQMAPPDWMQLYNRREYYNEDGEGIILPERCLFLVASADVQLDRIEAEIVGYGISEESWGIEYKIFRGSTETPALWNEFDQWVQKKFRHPSGHWLWPACVCIDSGNKPKPVYDYSFRCSPRQVYAVKGERGYVSNWVSRSGGSNHRLFILKVDGAKENLYSRLRLGEYGPGYQHYPSNEKCGYDSTYFQQICSESMRVAYIKGRYAPYFDKIHSGARNESLDVRVYGMAAKDILDVDYEAVQKYLLENPLNDWRPKMPEAPKVVEIVTEVPKNLQIDPPSYMPRRRPGSGWSKPF